MGQRKHAVCTRPGEKVAQQWSCCPVKYQQVILFVFKAKDDVTLACVWPVNSMTWLLHFWLEAGMFPFVWVSKGTSLTVENRDYTANGDRTQLNTLWTSNTSPHQQLGWKQHIPLILLGSNRRWEAFSGEHFENECILMLLGRQRFPDPFSSNA